MAPTWRHDEDQQRLYLIGDGGVEMGYLDPTTGRVGSVELGYGREVYTAAAAWRHANGLERIFTAEELHGLVCATCGLDLRERPEQRHVAVPTFAPGTLDQTTSIDQQLVACQGDCAAALSIDEKGLSGYRDPAPLADRIAAYAAR